MDINSNSNQGAELKVPRHLAVIMDGNGRWAEARGMIRVRGHQQGAEAVRRIIAAAVKAGVQILTLYAFSSENWKRPRTEVQALMKLLGRALTENAKTLNDNDIKVKIIGDVTALSGALQKSIHKLEDLTKDNQRMLLNIAINYGSRLELTRAVQQIAVKVQQGTLKPEDISEDLISRELYAPDNVDLLVRTGGEFRLSNFLLWQAAYAEIFVTDKLWPDFDEAELKRAFAFYSGRERRFGMTSAQIREQAGPGAADKTNIKPEQV